MAKIPANATPEPAAPAAPATEPTPAAPATPAVEPSAPSPEQLAELVGLDPSTMTPDDITFASAFADMEAERSGQTLEELLASGPSTSLIPSDEPSTPPSGEPSTPAIADPTTTGADGVGVGNPPDGPDAGASPTGAPATSPTYTPPEGLASPFPPGFGAPTPPATADDMVDLGNGVTVPRAYVRQMLEAQGIAPTPTFPSPPVPTPTYPPQQPYPPGQLPPNAPNAPNAPLIGQPAPFDPEQFVDPAMAAWVFQQQQQQQAILANQEAIAQRMALEQQQRDVYSLRAGAENFKSVRGITDEEQSQLVDLVQMNGSYQGYLQSLYPGDPKSAIEAALEATAWSVPHLRERFVQQMVANETQANAAVEDKKALAGSIQSTGGSAPRTASPAPPKNRDEAWAGVAAALEASMNGSGN